MMLYGLFVSAVLDVCVWFAAGVLCEVVCVLRVCVYVVTCLCVLFMMDRVMLYGLFVIVFVCLIACLLNM